MASSWKCVLLYVCMFYLSCCRRAAFALAAAEEENDGDVTFPECKFCSSRENKEKEGFCSFCPSTPKSSRFDTKISILGEGSTCLSVYQYFQRHNISHTDDRCTTATMFNFICDCEGPGYAGADSDTKRILLAWLPRVTATMSFMGSFAIILDVAKSRTTRQKVFGQLVIVMSLFDLAGSIAYALTTLPTPQEDHVYGSKGNQATCTAQGFFIHMSTVAAYINVSLSIYYYTTINLSWSEHKLQKFKPYLLAAPILVGLTLASVGIPFYDNMILWCNNTQKFWPDIPVLIACLLVTFIMFLVWLHVYREEKASNKWRRPKKGGATTNTTTRQSLSNKVFWQGFWYLMAFYITWPPYIILSFLWSSGHAFHMYGFVLWAGLVTPSQGAWNYLVYIRPRKNAIGRKMFSFLFKPCRLVFCKKRERS